jgi:predicted DNA-binding transcriptional regulator YafY
MSKRPAPLETLQIALELLRRVPKGRTITATELRLQLRDAGFEREPRTIQRLMETLSEFYNIERDESTKPYRYCWKENATGLSMPSLSNQEALILRLAEEQLNRLLPSKLLKSMQGFFAQAQGTLNSLGSAQNERQWLEKIRVVSTTQPLIPPKIDPDVFQQISDALYSNLWLEVAYQNANAKKTLSKVMPLGLVQQGPRMYLVCRFENYIDERCLALHRILSAQSSTLTFERPKNFSLKQFDEDGRFGYGDGKRIRLSFRIEKGAGLHLLESPLSDDQKVTELDKTYDVTATVVESAMLDKWIWGFGTQISRVKKKPTNAR